MSVKNICCLLISGETHCSGSFGEPGSLVDFSKLDQYNDSDIPAGKLFVLNAMERKQLWLKYISTCAVSAG